MGKFLVTTAVAVTLLVLAGCSQERAESTAAPTATAVSTPTVSPSSTTTPSPTPTEISREDAAAQYLALVGPYNDTVYRYDEVAAAEWDLAAFTSAAQAQADANQAFVTGLMTMEWPAETLDTVQALAAEAAPNTSYMRRLAEVQSVEDARSVFETRPEQTDGSAQLLRIQLGLDEVPVVQTTPAPPVDDATV